VNKLFQLRPLLTKITCILFLAVVLAGNVYIYLREHVGASVFLTLVVPAFTLVTTLAPEIANSIGKRLGPTAQERYCATVVNAFRQFYLDYFSIQLPTPHVPQAMSVASHLELLVASLEGPLFARAVSADKRRKSLTIPLFLVHAYNAIAVTEHPEVHAYIRATTRRLKGTGEREFLSAFNEIVLHNRKYPEPPSYFPPLDDSILPRVRFVFYDRFLKDDYIQQITKKLKLTEAQVRSFKASLRSIGSSDRFNLEFLKQFVQKRKAYRKLFLLVSDKKLPRPIQAYITQNPHFILDYSSIANLPVIGISDRFDIFFFSPSELVPNASALLDRLRSLDAGLSTHPLKVYEIDPVEGVATDLPRNSHFTQSLSYFENGSVDTTSLADLTYDQVIALLQRNRVSLRELFSEFPPGELAASASKAERRLISEVARPLTKTTAGVDMFALLGQAGELRKKLNSLDPSSIQYTAAEIAHLFGGDLTARRFRKRLHNLATEALANLESLDDMLR